MSTAGLHRKEMDPMLDDDDQEEDLGFSRSYFLARELGGLSPNKSKHKLSDIDLFDEQDLRAAESKIEGKHEQETASLLNRYKHQYSRWLFELRCGLGLLMYGFGSKKLLLEDFASSTLKDFGVVVINGYLPSVNIKQATLLIAEVLQSQLKTRRKQSGWSKSKHSFSSQSMEDILSFLNEQHSNDNDCFVCVIIHNIDGPALRDMDSQHYLSLIACCSHVRVIASIDHVNAPLLWDKKMVHTQFNWCWYHVPTYQSYKVEGIFYPLILSSRAASQTTKTALVVLQSLTPNAQGVFKVLAEYQLANQKDEGMHVSALYAKCRERFFVSSQVTLNSHLTEFKDHELIKFRRHPDGQDCIYIPLPSDALEKLLEDLA